jgi:hypothetical protein
MIGDHMKADYVRVRGLLFEYLKQEHKDGLFSVSSGTGFVPA